MRTPELFFFLVALDRGPMFPNQGLDPRPAPELEGWSKHIPVGNDLSVPPTEPLEEGCLCNTLDPWRSVGVLFPQHREGAWNFKTQMQK